MAPGPTRRSELVGGIMPQLLNAPVDRRDNPAIFYYGSRASPGAPVGRLSDEKFLEGLG